MIGQHFSHETLKTATAVFGSLFNNIVIKRKDGKILPIPIAYGPRYKWVEGSKELDRNQEMFEKLLPRISYEMVAMQYDSNRKLTNKQTLIRTPDIQDIPRNRVHLPVPYNLDFSLYIQTKNLNDGWQIIEQILPFFTPAYTVQVRHYPVDADPKTPLPENVFDMPVTLTAVTWADDWTGDVQDRRLVEWTLEFSTKIYLYGPVPSTSIIYDSRAVISTPPAGISIGSLTRASAQEGIEVGYINRDSEDRTTIFTNDSDLSPTIINLSDSDGNVIKVIRDLPVK